MNYVQGRILDIGCGAGRHSLSLQKKGFDVLGIDISPLAVNVCKLRGLKKAKVIGIEKLDAKLGEFDTIISTMALMDSPNYPKVVKEFFRVLQPDGELFFSITHPCFLTKGFNWIKDEKGTSIKLTVSNYFDTHPQIERWKFSKAPVPEKIPSFTIPGFYQTISEYLNTLIEAGFVIKRITEPRPSESQCKKHPWLRRWRDHAAIFLYINVQKP